MALKFSDNESLLLAWLYPFLFRRQHHVTKLKPIQQLTSRHTHLAAVEGRGVRGQASTETVRTLPLARRSLLPEHLEVRRDPVYHLDSDTSYSPRPYIPSIIFLTLQSISKSSLHDPVVMFHVMTKTAQALHAITHPNTESSNPSPPLPRVKRKGSSSLISHLRATFRTKGSLTFWTVPLYFDSRERTTAESCELSLSLSNGAELTCFSNLIQLFFIIQTMWFSGARFEHGE